MVLIAVRNLDFMEESIREARDGLVGSGFGDPSGFGGCNSGTQVDGRGSVGPKAFTFIPEVRA
jgi:hypothetical protein